MVSARHGTVHAHVDAPPEAVWALLADVERMGEWSPECYRVAWLGGVSTPATPGARFKGWNRYGPLRWTMTCEIKTADPGKEISWCTTQKDRDLVRWTYRLRPADGGTEVVESFDVIWLPFTARLAEDYLMRDRDRRREEAMRTTLEHIGAAVRHRP